MYFDLRLNYITQKYLEPLSSCFCVFLTWVKSSIQYWGAIPYYRATPFWIFSSIYNELKDFPFNWCRQTILCPRWVLWSLIYLFIWDACFSCFKQFSHIHLLVNTQLATLGQPLTDCQDSLCIAMSLPLFSSLNFSCIGLPSSILNSLCISQTCF